MVHKNTQYEGSIKWNFNGVIEREGVSTFDLTDPEKFNECIDKLRQEYSEVYSDLTADRAVKVGDLIHYGMFLFRIIKIDSKEIKLLQENILDKCTKNDIASILDDDNDDYMMLDFLLYAVPQFGPLKCAVSLLHLPFELEEKDCSGWPEGLKEFGMERFWAFNHRTDGSIELVAAKQVHKYPICGISDWVIHPDGELPIRFMLTMKRDKDHLEMLKQYRIRKVDA